MNISEILIMVLIIAVIYCCNKENKENLYIYPKCNHIKPFINKYSESYYNSNMDNCYDCYHRCIQNSDCNYPMISADCWNGCCDNIGKSENNTLGDYNQ
jgi:hypothetical protein